MAIRVVEQLHHLGEVQEGAAKAVDFVDDDGLDLAGLELSRQLADAQLVDAMGVTDPCILVHLDHPSPPCSDSMFMLLKYPRVASVSNRVISKYLCRGQHAWRKTIWWTRRESN